MNRRYSTVPLALATVTLFGCQTPEPNGSLAQIKRDQESRLMFNCVNQYGTVMHGGLSMDLIQACREDANARVW